MTDTTAPWRGSWVWAEGADSGAGRTVVALRRDLHLDEVPGAVRCRIAAVGRYALVVNGVEVARGPARSNPRRGVYDAIDIGTHLRAGLNAVGVLAWCWSHPMPWWHPLPSGRGGLAGGAVALDADVEGLSTDVSWSALSLDGWESGAPDGIPGRGVEVVDARSLPPDWLEPGAAAAWPSAVTRAPYSPGMPRRTEPPSYPVGPVLRRELRASVVERRLMPSGATWTTGDIGVVSGTVRCTIDGPAGGVVEIRVAEKRGGDGQPFPDHNDTGFRLVADGSSRVLESLDPYGLSGLVIAAPEGLAVREVTVVERTHPLIGAHAFECSDPRLTAIWSAGRRTVTLCSHDAYVDCPTREQRAWVGDAVVHQLVDLATNDDWSLARWYPLLAAAPRADGMLPMVIGGDAEATDNLVIPDWALHWVHAVWNLYRYVGDRREVASLLGVVEGVLRWFEPFCDDDGLPRDVMGGVLIDWAAVRTDGTSAALCGLWARALLEFAEMAQWLGDVGRVTWARTTHARLSAGFERLWDPDRGRYVDTLVDGVRLPMVSQHGQAAAIVGQLAPADRWQRLIGVITDEEHLVHAAFDAPDGPARPNAELEIGGYLDGGRPDPWWDVDRQVVRAQPFFRYVVHDALDLAGRRDLIASACLDWAVALERCATSLSETWYGGTTCHGWSATPTRDLTTRVLGIEPAEPGFATARIAPALGPLDWARGSAPTPAGPLRVFVDRSELRVDSPLPFVVGTQTYGPGTHVLPPSADVRPAAPA
ncbi:MAG: alpha-L-rhamnosidase [Frankiales bacterium]|nr:alpha-L-rhamnosidase [Frankiales bacterium]